jgi:hypothetical protein
VLFPRSEADCQAFLLSQRGYQKVCVRVIT